MTVVTCSLRSSVRLTHTKLLNPENLGTYNNTTDAPTLVVLAAGKGTRFGQEPKCIQPIHGTPVARHSIDSFRSIAPSHNRSLSAICIVGYRHMEVSAALGSDNIYVCSDNPTGGTAFAAYEAFCVPALLEQDPLLIITMGDRIIPPSIYRQLWETHCQGDREAELTLLTSQYEPPHNRGKGRILRNSNGDVVDIVEEKDIMAEQNDEQRETLLALTEGNCPLYMIRARALHRLLQNLTNDNAQGQYYLTDIIKAISCEGGDIRTITTKASEPAYDLLCADLTHASDLVRLENILAEAHYL